ncbi:glycosyltransferase [Halapricum sp. CBA1109]|uniref:glycosyltransferase family 2 protein n=1 Tax=Halapricum sp. CBA1109 TaxID=2668068 RepID=UPI0012F835B9|nr:glycosyltransferase family 2 protein [Halapricum sp. CBA1109]MUV88595.1 glycosyltransferase [Halapricum sp. CBA1109]
MTTPSVSSITITLNEESNIGECIDSVDWCDEHIVVDEYSDDNTIEEAKSHGANVFTAETPDDANSFDILRSKAIDYASHDWILRIDADERSTPSLNRRLQQLVGQDGVDLVRVPRQTYIGQKWITSGDRWWPDRCPMLFRAESIEISDQIHQYIVPKSDADIIELPATEETSLNHYSYSSLPDLARRRWRYAESDGQSRNIGLSYVILATAQDFFTGIIKDEGFRNGIVGIAVPIIDSLYNIAVAYYSIRENNI